jgi:SAM-dependent methyltransferase
MDDFRHLQRIHAGDPEYIQQAAAEAAFWQQVVPDSLEALEGEIVEGVSERYTNRRFTGDPSTPWEETICRWGTFRRGLALGTASLSLEARLLATNPQLHLTFIDISDGPLERRRVALGGRFPGRVDTRVADLNFAEFEPEKFDLIVSSSTMHHVTNLEYLAAQINQALTTDGCFFLQDYVGEPRFQFDQHKKDVYAGVFARLAAREARSPELHWSSVDDLSPFCGVRSDEILPVLSSHLTHVETRTAGALLIAMMRSQPVAAPTRRAGRLGWFARRVHRRLSRLVGRRQKKL